MATRLQEGLGTRHHVEPPEDEDKKHNEDVTFIRRIWRWFRILFSEVADVVRQGAAIFMAGWRIDSRVKWTMTGLIILNCGIAYVETWVPYVLGQAVDTMTIAFNFARNGGDIGVSLSSFLIRLAGLFMLIYMAKDLLEFVRELLLNRVFRPQIRASTALLAAEQAVQHPEAMRVRQPKDRQPILIAGMDNFSELVELLTRDPWIALRSPMILIGFFTFPLAASVLAFQLMYELLITGWIQRHVAPLWDKRQTRMNRVAHGAIMVLKLATPYRRQRMEQMYNGFSARVVRLVTQWRRVGTKDAVASHFVRDGLSNVFQYMLWAALAWYVWQGDISPGQFTEMALLAVQATAPMKALYTLQRDLMRRRRSLYDLGNLCNYSFGVPRVPPT